MVTFPTEAQWATAVKAALTAVNAAPHDYGMTIPASVTAYNLVTVTDRFGGVARMNGRIGTRGVRITIVSLGLAVNPATPLNNAREMRRRHDLALRGQRLTVAGFVTTPIQFETADPIDQDGDPVTAGAWFSGLTHYTAVI